MVRTTKSNQSQPKFLYIVVLEYSSIREYCLMVLEYSNINNRLYEYSNISNRILAYGDMLDNFCECVTQKPYGNTC